MRFPTGRGIVTATVAAMILLLSTACSSDGEATAAEAESSDIEADPEATEPDEVDTAPEAPTAQTDTGTDEESARAMEIALAFMEARNQRDADALLALLSPDVVIHDFGRWPRTYDEYAALVEWMDIFDWRWELQECVEHSAGAQILMVCNYLMENDWSRAQGVDPVPGTIDLLVDGDVIVEVDADTGQWVPIAFVPWVEWLEREHREDIPTLFRLDEENRLTGGPATDPEALALYRTYLVEYVEHATDLSNQELENDDEN